MRRRDFVASAAGAGAAFSLFPAGLAGLEREKSSGRLERRSLGKTGEKLSIIGFGGIVVMNATTEQAAERVRHAIDLGVNYFSLFARASSSPARRRSGQRPRRSLSWSRRSGNSARTISTSINTTP